VIKVTIYEINDLQTFSISMKQTFMTTLQVIVTLRSTIVNEHFEISLTLLHSTFFYIFLGNIS